ncbi:MAG TPA: cyclic nucleotide-binding domain-containing protein, partial [Xanthobacteraceae bacterium]|nr:cyclic nucleotide-binding domain-containing protein [Xanthobacteraceae bacterium]
EDDLLKNEGHITSSAEIPLEKLGLLGSFKPEEIAALSKRIRRERYAAGKPVFNEGDPGEEVFIIAKGTASVFIKQPGGNIRLATFAPGTVFGELALLDEGKRSASVIADEELVCYGMTKANFAALAEEAPAVAIRFLSALARELSSRLRAANRTVHQLES